jgi:hypothetical protein
MQDDPKNPNAWWAVQILPLRKILPGKLSKTQKKRLIWVIPLVFILVSVEAFYLIKLLRTAPW